MKSTKTKKTTNNLVIVEWEDIETFNAESLKNVLKSKVELVKTYGVLVHEDDWYTVVMTHDGMAEEGNDYVRIITPLIKNIRRLK